MFQSSVILTSAEYFSIQSISRLIDGYKDVPFCPAYVEYTVQVLSCSSLTLSHHVLELLHALLLLLVLAVLARGPFKLHLGAPSHLLS